MEEIKYTFNVKGFYCLVRLIESCRPELAKTFIEIEKMQANQVDQNNKENLNVLSQFLEGALIVIIKSEGHTYDLLRATTNLNDAQIQSLSFLEYVKTLKGLFSSIQWEEILGELKSLIPETVQEKIQSYLNLKKKEKQTSSN